VTTVAPDRAERPDLTRGELVVLGRVMPASNATFVGEVDGVRVAYKPVRGERPLWDFPDGTLALREYATFLVSEATGWDVVTLTLLREGPHGPGMVQWWREPTATTEAVDVLPAGPVPPGRLHVLDGLDEDEKPVQVVHEDSAALRRMALLDAVVNNSDRKGGHVLAMADGHRYGVDHGLTFHVDDKLRTVLWGWSGQPVPEEDLSVVAGLRDLLGGSLGDELAELLADEEIARTQERCERLLLTGRMPEPDGGWPAIPWPPF